MRKLWQNNNRWGGGPLDYFRQAIRALVAWIVWKLIEIGAVLMLWAIMFETFVGFDRFF
tara:strand:+ start:7126 stop:7302 length:177 start_codon:yes stop_codon:yes gene_type:complete